MLESSPRREAARAAFSSSIVSCEKRTANEKKEMPTIAQDEEALGVGEGGGAEQGG